MRKTVKESLHLSRDFYPRLMLGPIIVGICIFVLTHPSVDNSYLWGSLLCFFIFDNLGVQIGVHKLLCHRSFKTTAFIKRSLAMLSIFSGQGSPLVWVAVHMGSHHPHYDTDGDVHSPKFGRFYAFIAWYWRLDKSRVSFLPAREYYKDKFLRFLNERHLEILLCYWILLFLIGGFLALFFFGLLPAACSVILAGFVNCFMHSHNKVVDLVFFKYQNHPNIVTAYNSVWLGLLTMGLGLHNNHHNTPSAPYYDERWYELDLARLIIPLIQTKL